MNQLNKVRLCLFLNTCLVLFIGFYITNFAAQSPYFRFGPNEDFIFISVQINTTQKYCSLLALIFVNDVIRVIIQEFGSPILFMNVYNPDKKEITEFSKFQLYFYANSMFLVNNIRYIFTLLISVTQIDIALFSVLVEEVIVIFTIKMLLDEKKFINKKSFLNKEVAMLDIEMDSIDCNK
jgi:hypothetical protein